MHSALQAHTEKPLGQNGSLAHHYCPEKIVAVYCPQLGLAIGIARAHVPAIEVQLITAGMWGAARPLKRQLQATQKLSRFYVQAPFFRLEEM